MNVALGPGIQIIITEKKYDFLGAFAKLRKATVSFVMSVCPSVLPSAWNNSASTGRIFMKFYIRASFENLSTESSFVEIWQE